MDPTLLIGDIVERDTLEKKPVVFPTPPLTSTGFPQHKKRWRTSAFRQQRSETGGKGTALPSDQSRGNSSPGARRSQTQFPGFDDMERMRIDQENRQKLASMTPQEIAQAQDDIMTGFNPALIQRLLQRANIDEPSPSPFDNPQQGADREAPESQESSAPQSNPAQSTLSRSAQESVQGLSESTHPKTPLGINAATSGGSGHTKTVDDYDEDSAPAQIPPELFPITDQPRSIHFPAAPNLPDLDPSDPNFLAALHEKYFPNLPADPSKLAWMAPVPSTDSPADQDSPYYPHPEISVSALRFDFRGRFLSPRVSRSIPSTKGLHHHGEAPEAAGYTVAELARLARSAVPAQRCMAYQTLGRILFRLGQGEWGKTENDPIATGIWAAVKKGRVLESLMEAAAGEGGHRGSRAYATEALWLFEKGGWKETFKGR